MSFIHKIPFFGKKPPQSASIPDLASSDDPQAALVKVINVLMLDRKEERSNKTLRAWIYFMIFGVPALLYGAVAVKASGWSPFADKPMVAVVHIDGPIAPDATASADHVIPALTKAFESDHVKGVVLSIDSGGGAPLESERIYRAMESLRKAHPKPIVAVINNFGASAAYMIALHADKIYAGKYSLVGSIGAVMTGWDVHKALAKYDVSHRVFASGSLKAMLNPYVAMTPEAEHKAQQLVEDMGTQFLSELKAKRGKTLKANVNYGSGEAWVGQSAKEIGVVDEISTIDQVVKATWDLPTKDFGPAELRLPILSASADWLSDVAAKTITKVNAATNEVSVR